MRSFAEISSLFLSGQPWPADQELPSAIAAQGPEGLAHYLHRSRPADPSLGRELTRRLAARPESSSTPAEVASLIGTLVLDRQGIIRQADHPALSMLGAEPELRDRVFNYFFQPHEPVLIGIRRPGGSTGIAEMVAEPIRHQRQSVYLVTIRDVTPLKRKTISGAPGKSFPDW